MSWESPIEIIVNEMAFKWMEGTMKAIQEVGIKVDREELIKALQYDRNQYVKGYEDGINDSQIVRCKDCKHRDPEDKKCDCGHGIIWQLPRDNNWFCADGERRTDAVE